MSLLPNRPDVSPSPETPRVLEVSDEDADAAFDALSSETARRVLSAIYEEPRAPAAVREEVGTSLQNVHYHLDNLETAGLIEPAGTGYSETGTEVTIYAPSSEAVVLFAGDADDASRLRDRLAGLFGLALVVGAATAVFAAATDWLAADSAETDDGAALSAGAAADGAAVDPVVAFLLGGCAVAAVVACWWLVRPRLRSRASSR